MKKTLSIILAILMVVATVPFAFAAESGDFKYSITDEVAVITGYNGDSGALEIPATIDGYPVSVDSSAFRNNEEITSLTFYGDIVFNEFYTFKDCTNLTTVTFAGDADFNANYTFFGCTNLKNITFIGNVNTYKDNGYYYPFFKSNDTHSVEVHFGGTEGEWESSADLMGHDNCPIKNATPHYCTEKDVIAKTCTEDGYQAGWYCSDCEKYVVGGEVIPASHEIETVEAKAPTCTEIGWDAYEYCTECDYTTYDEKPELGHDIIIDAYVAPKCEETGLTAGQHCSRCDAMTIAQEVVPALNHKDTLVQVEAKAPTCTEIGWDAYEYCTACDYSTYTEKAALNHKDTLVKVEAKAPTCTEIGWDAYEYCTACDYTTYAEKAALDHDIVIDEAVAATCTQAGLTAGQHCSRCDDMTIAQEVIPDLGGHINEDGNTTCDRCGEQLTCEDCGRPVHAEEGIPQYICWLITLIKMIVSFFK